MGKNIIIYLLFLNVFNCFSQNNISTLISPQGGFDKTEFISLEWSLGEIFVETINLSDNIITQGFHQSYFNTSSTLDISQPLENLFNIIVFPNPTNSELNVYISEKLNIDYSLYDLNGRLIKQSLSNNINFNIQIDIKNLAVGIYILKLSNSNGLFLEEHKIIKY